MHSLIPYIHIYSDKQAPGINADSAEVVNDLGSEVNISTK